MGKNNISVFKLPKDATIELLGENSISPYPSVSEYSVFEVSEESGTGTIIIKCSGTICALSEAESDIRTLIKSTNSNVKLEGGERSGKIESRNGVVTLVNGIIPDAKELEITASPTSITTKNVTVNGTLKL